MGSSGGVLTERLFSTGNVFLDRRVGGGIRQGSLLALVAHPQSQCQTFLREFAAARRSLYVSTICPDEDELRERFLPPDADASTAYVAPDALVEEPDAVLDRIEPETYVLLDAMTPVEAEADRSALLELLHALKRRVDETDSVCVLLCHRDDDGGHPTSTTLHRADVVWQLRPAFGNRQLGYRLLVTKVRGGRAPPEPIPLLVTDRVEIDTSWSI